MSATPEQIAEAAKMGKEAAEAVATWTTDGNGDIDVYRRALAMLNDGDPAVYDFLPREPNLSGEFADDPTPLSLARGVTGEEDPDPDTIDALADAFEQAVMEHFAPACERELIAATK